MIYLRSWLRILLKDYLTDSMIEIAMRQLLSIGFDRRTQQRMNKAVNIFKDNRKAILSAWVEKQ